MQAEKFLQLLFPELQVYGVGKSQGFMRRDADAPYETSADIDPYEGAEDLRADGDAGDYAGNPILRLLFPELQVWDAGVAYGFMGGKEPAPSANEMGYASAGDVLEGEPEGLLSDEARARKKAAAAERRSWLRGKRASGSDSASEVAASLSPGYLSSEEREAALRRGSQKSQSWADEQARAYVKAQAQAQGQAAASDAADADVADAAEAQGAASASAESFAEARARRAREGDSGDKHEGNE